MEEYKLLRREAIEPREYQLRIAETASKRNTLVVLPTGMGKCHAYDDPILLSNGEIVKIGELVEESLKKSTKKFIINPIMEITLDNPSNTKVISLDSNGLKEKRILHFCKFKTNKVIKIITSGGVEINITPEHPLLTLKNGKLKWLSVNDLSVNDYIAIPREVKIKSSENQKFNLLGLLNQKLPNMSFWLKLSGGEEILLNEAVKNKINKNRIAAILVKGARAVRIPIKPIWKITPELCRWIALVIAEGTIGGGVKFYNTDSTLLKDFRDLSKKIFGVECKEIEGGLEIKSTAVVLFLRYVFDIRPEHSRSKKIPKIILTASKKCVTAFLKGLYDGEGSIDIKNGVIEFSTASKELANQVCYLLLRNYIRSRKPKTKFVKNRPYYRVYIEGIRNIRKFAECIGFDHPLKAKLLGIYLKKIQKSGTNIDVVPANDIIKDIRRTLRLKSSKYKDFKGLSDITIYETKKRKPSLEMLKKIVKRFEKQYNEISKKKEEIRYLERSLDLILSFSNFCRELSTRSDFLSILDRANVSLKQFDGWLQKNISPRIRKNAPIIRMLKILNKDFDVEILWTYIKELKKVLRISGWELRKNNLVYTKCSNSRKLAKLINYILKIWKSVLDCKKKIDFLKKLITLPIMWDKIKIKRNIKKPQFVYDITVEDGHNFIAGKNGGVFSHNTFVAVLVTANRLQKYPESKAMILSPTRPLCAQIQKVFRNNLNIKPDKIILITGRIRPEDRENLYKKGKIIVSTPQCIDFDLKSNRINLTDFSIVTFDESHRSIGNYSYTFVAKKYREQSKYPLILGLTASPGGSYERIEEIRKNLFIEAVEIRTELDKDVEKYVKPIAREWVYVELPEEFKKIKTLLEERLKEDLFWLRDHNFLQTLRPSKKSLLMLQKKFGSMLMEGARNYSLFWAMIKVSEAIKIDYALELLETQGISPLYEYLKKVEASKKKSDKQLIKDQRIREVIKSTEELHAKGIEHPKFEKLLYIVKDLLREKPDARIIVFANYRSTVDRINELMRKEGIKSEILIGQAIKKGKGLTQQQQLEILKRFSNAEFNVLPTSSIGEEGIDYFADVAVFFEAVPSEIRGLQRRGRVGRQKAGRVIFLLTKDTRDEAYYWAAFQKERKMKGILYDLKEKTAKKTILDWVKK